MARVTLKCENCGNVIKAKDKFCENCGKAVNVKEEEKIVQEIKYVKPSDFDTLYSKPEETIINTIIKQEIKNADINLKDNLIPIDAYRKKIILNILYSILVFVFTILIFFHFPLYTYIFGLLILFFTNKLTKKYDFIMYITKEVKGRPGEKISNIVMNTKNSLVKNNLFMIKIISIITAVIIGCLVFTKPRIMYEEMENGYGVRYYAFGITNFTKATIPEKYNNKPVISLRGNTFSNMPFLKEVNLPDTITEIRGQAFKNCRNLSKVNIPKNLEYLGGGAFYNAKKIEKIELPDTLTYLGGEAFYNAKSLKEIKLSNSLNEIRGDTFEYCTSLEKIEIPDNITRIGGHAFYGDTNLKEVIFTENSKLTEIGSSAFRRCNSLYEITIPYNVSVNERSFKESPTNVKHFQVDISEMTNKYTKTTTHTFTENGEFVIEDGDNTITIELEYIMRYSRIASFRIKSDSYIWYKYGSVDIDKGFEEIGNVLIKVTNYNDENNVLEVEIYY